jgi:hypothetical protein
LIRAVVEVIKPRYVEDLRKERVIAAFTSANKAIGQRIMARGRREQPGSPLQTSARTAAISASEC